MELNYRAAVLTHADHDYKPVLDSLREHVMPLPDAVTVYRDAAPQRGFCAATAKLWKLCIAAEEEYILWLEMDFCFDRDVDLRDLADILDADHTLSQVSLMRDAVSDQEKAAGGLFEHRNGAVNWERHKWGYTQLDYVVTTNPSLMRREFMAANPWPDHTQFCEGKFSIELREKGYRGGVYGDGSVYVRHVGTRTGFGY